MYAVINIPGSSHFRFFGPASRAECAAWLDATVQREQRTQLLTSLLPQRLVSNREAESWRYRDGSRVVRPGAADEIGCPACGKPDWAPQHAEGCMHEEGV